MLPEAGQDLDREVARRLGEEGPSVSCYSTDPRAADELIARLGRSEVLAACEKVGSLWYCTLSTTFGTSRERLATGAGTSRALALCRAVVNLTAERLWLRPQEPGA